MRLLLDTHAFLWLVEGDSRLSAAARTALADPPHDLFLSVASVWELAIKVGAGKLTLNDLFDVFVGKGASYQLAPLPILTSHAPAVTALPGHHRDPFDRLLIAQAQIEDMTLASGDSKFASYDVPVLW